MAQPHRNSARKLADQAVADEVFGFAEFAQTSNLLAEVDADLAGRLRRFDIHNFIFVQALDRGRRASGAFVSGRSYEAWREHYDSWELAPLDTLLQSGLDSPEPHSWSNYQKGEISDGMKKVFNEAEEFGLADGYYVPVHQLDGAVFGVSFMGRSKMADDPRTCAALHMLAVYYSIAVQRLAKPRMDEVVEAKAEGGSLTPRQRECLQWVRAGKSDWEIGQIVGISEHTVAEHIEGARHRLNVRTRTQAVLEAIAQGLIQL